MEANSQKFALNAFLAVTVHSNLILSLCFSDPEAKIKV